jgi:hypothetical protein
MSGRLLKRAIGLAIAAQSIAAGPANGADYRGMTAGWPAYANGYYAANYPTNSGAGPAYYVARPVAAAGYAVPPTGTMYAPVRAAYANPTYYAAYGRTPAVYRPVTAVGYAPAAGGYYPPTAAYYAPVTANYAPANSYAVSPAGIGSGSEAAAYYGQPTSLNYVPPQYAYRTNYAPVPVYMYRPVTAYQPVTGQPVTCLQASTCNTCQPQRSRFSILNPFTWFGSGSSCGSSGCGYTGCGSAPTTSYCNPAYCGTTGCGQQPYYPTQPLTPVVPVIPGPALPANTIPSFPRGTAIPPAGTTIPPPPTRTIVPGTTIMPGSSGGFAPADLAPRLQPGPTFGPAPSTTITPLPSNTIPAQPVTPLPGGSFQTTPIQPGVNPGSFGTGTNYPPAVDPYSAALTPAASLNPAVNQTTPSSSSPAGPNHSVFGSGYRGSSPARNDVPRKDTAADGVIRAPDLGPALPPSVRTVPDLDAPQSPKPVNAAPQLLDPRDKTASRDPRWAVVPAQWPKKEVAPRQLSERPVVATKAHEPREMAASPYMRSQPNAADYDDGGWKSAR